MSENNKPVFGMGPGLSMHKEGLFFGGLIGVMMGFSAIICSWAFAPFMLGATGAYAAAGILNGYLILAMGAACIGGMVAVGYSVLKKTQETKHVVTGVCSAIAACAMIVGANYGYGPYQLAETIKSAFNSSSCDKQDNSKQTTGVFKQRCPSAQK